MNSIILKLETKWKNVWWSKNKLIISMIVTNTFKALYGELLMYEFSPTMKPLVNKLSAI